MYNSRFHNYVALVTLSLMVGNSFCQQALVITGCPDNITRAVYQNEGAFVTWQEPSASGESVGPPQRSHSPGDFFYIPTTTTVTYNFTDGLGNSESCVFSIRIAFASCAENEFQCSHNGRCIAAENKCNMVADCGDASDEIECPLNEDCMNVGQLEGQMTGDCFDIDYLPYQFSITDPLSWKFTVPSDKPHYLLSLDIEFNQLSIGFQLISAGPASVFNVTITTSESAQTLMYLVDEYENKAVRNNSVVPPRLEPGEDVNVSISYTPDFLNEPFQSLISRESSCRNCIRLQTASYRYPQCNGNGFVRCMQRYYVYKESAAANQQCPLPNLMAFQDVLSPCLDTINIDQLGSLTIFGCPDEISRFAAPGSNGIIVQWNEPLAVDASGFQAGVEPNSEYGPGSLLPFGSTSIEYLFFIEQGTYSCTFNVTIRAVSCGADEFTCNTGQCIPQEHVCSGLPECSDRSDETDESCTGLFEMCSNIAELQGNFLETCFDDVDSSGLNPSGTNIPIVSSGIIPWNFTYFAQSNSGPTFILQIRISFTQIYDLYSISREDPAPAFYLNLQTTQSLHEEEIILAVPDFIEELFVLPLSNPLKLQDNDNVLVSLKYTPDFLNGAETMPINWNSDCPNCVAVHVAISHAYPNCEDYLQPNSPQRAQCMINYYLWNKAEIQMPQCGTSAYEQAFKEIFDDCSNELGIRGTDPLFVLGCPNEIVRTVGPEGGLFYWMDPVFITAMGQSVETATQSHYSGGTFFEIGNTEVQITSQTVQNASAIDCRFIVTAMSPSCEDNQFLCNNGRCVPSDHECNFFDDCGDGSDEESRSCSIKRDMCAEILEPRDNALDMFCPEPEPEPGSQPQYIPVFERNGNDESLPQPPTPPQFVWKYKVPIDKDNIYMTGVEVNEYSIQDIIGLDNGLYKFDIAVYTTRSKQTATAFKLYSTQEDPRKKRQSKGSFQQSGLFRIPLKLSRNEEIHIRVNFTRDFLNDDSRPVQYDEYDCSFCVRPRTQTFRPGCAGGFDNGCLSNFANWTRALMDSPQDLIDQCTIGAADELYLDLYRECLSAPTFKFVDDNYRYETGSYTNLRCVAQGIPPPLVNWIRGSDRQVIANGTGVLGVTVNVTDVDETYTCAISNFLGRNRTEVMVGPYSPGCLSDKSIRGDQYLRNETCSSEESLESNSWYNNFDEVVFSFFGGFNNRNSYLHTVSLPGNALKSINPQLLPIQTAVDIIIRKINLGRRRRKREIDERILYSRRYEYVFFAPTVGDVDFKLEPFVSTSDLAAFESLEVSVSLVGEVFGERSGEVDVRMMLKYGACPGSGQIGGGKVRRKRQMSSDSCEAIYSDLLDVDRAAKQEMCGIDDRRFHALQLCLGEASAEPMIQVHPRTHQAQRGSVTDINCFIENAISYKWEKVSSDAPNQALDEVKSNTLQFRNFQATDQGMYRCIGMGGGEYQAQRVRSRPAVLTAEGVSTFLLTVRIPEPQISVARLERGDFERDPSQWFASRLQQPEDPVLTKAGFSGAETRGYKPGSVIIETLLFYASNNNDTELEEALLGYIEDQMSIGGFESPDYGGASFFGIGEGDIASLTITSLGSCPYEVTSGPNGKVLTWPQTPINVVADSVESCAEYSANAGIPRATRLCKGDFLTTPVWENPMYSDCFEGEDTDEQLDIIAETEVTMDNVEQVASDVADLTTDTDIGVDGLVDIAIILENIADVEDPSDGVSTSFVETVDNILDIDEEEFVDTMDYNVSSRIVKSLERQITTLQKQGLNFTEVRRNIGVRTIQLPMDSPSLLNGIGFISRSPKEGTFQAKDTDVVFDTEDVDINQDKFEASITVPEEAVNALRINGSTSVPVSFFIYQNSKLFQSRKLVKQSKELESEGARRIVGSRIIAATIEGADVQGLSTDDPVMSAFVIIEEKTLSKQNDTTTVVDKEQCVFWDFKLANGTGEWSTKGCSRVKVPGTDRVVCHCNHLTSFAVLVDVHNNKSFILDIISKIGCAVSIVALIFTIITHLLIKKMRKNQPQRILINLCVALLCLYIVFLAGVDATGSRIGCIIVAVLLHYFTLATLMWMAMEAVNMYLLFVKVLNAYISKFMIKASIIAWGVPLIVVVVNIALDYAEVVDVSKVYENVDHCFMNIGLEFYLGQLLLIGIILLFNFIVFTMVIYKISFRKNMTSNEKDKKKEIMKRLQNAVVISVLLGLTWVFGFFAIIDGATFAFQLIFCVANSLQGLFIFLLFCVRNNDVRKTWKAWLCCKKTDYRKGSAPYTSSGGTAGTGGTHSTAGDSSTIPMNQRGGRH